MKRLIKEFTAGNAMLSVLAVVASFIVGGILIAVSSEDVQTTREVPKPGSVWVDPALLESLNLQLGDRLWLGDKDLRITALIHREPDRGANFMNFAPRVMMHHDDVAATGLVQPASRISYGLPMSMNPH